MIPGLETDRLLLCPLELADAEQVQQIFPPWEIVRYLANVVPWPYPPDGALTYYRDVALPAMARGEQWHWTLRPRTEPQRIIGNVSLMKGENNNRGFWLDLLAGQRDHERGGRSRDRLLVQLSRLFVDESPEGRTKSRFQTDLREERDAYGRR